MNDGGAVASSRLITAAIHMIEFRVCKRTNATVSELLLLLCK
jgi:hypothetical protein